MEFGFTEGQQKLRKEVRDFMLNELPQDYQSFLFSIISIDDKCAIYSQELQRRTGEKGWLTPSWPKAYGGLGFGHIERAVVCEEVGRWIVAWPNYVGIETAGPTMLLYGTEEQKKKFLPPVSQGKVQWDQLFTEPNAGSDDANIQLRATQSGDYFVFNGQKMFVGEVYESDYLYTLARTADSVPKHRGLTLFLIPTSTQGIRSRPLRCLSGQTKREFFFDDVRVHKEYMIGELNRGFYHAMTTLQLERAFMGNPSCDQRAFEEFVQYCKETKRNGKPLIEDPKVRELLAQMAIDLEVDRLAFWHSVWWVSEEEKLGPLKYDLSIFLRRTFATSRLKMMMDILGPYGELEPGSKWVPLAGAIERQWLQARSFHAGGTTEILKLVLAERGLDLPRRH